jgi:hypothetical protein
MEEHEKKLVAILWCNVELKKIHKKREMDSNSPYLILKLWKAGFVTMKGREIELVVVF